MRILLLLLIAASFSLLSAEASNTDARDSAKSLYQRGEFRKAIRAYDKILNANPADKEALRFRGLAHMALGKYKEGQQDFLSSSSDADTDSNSVAKGADPNKVSAQELYRTGCVALLTPDYDTALTYFKQALNLFPRYRDCLNTMASALNAKADYDDAIAVCIDELSYYPSDFGLWENLSLFCNNRGNYKYSVTAAKIALSLSPPESDQKALMNLLTNDSQAIHELNMQPSAPDFGP